MALAAPLFLTPNQLFLLLPQSAVLGALEQKTTIRFLHGLFFRSMIGLGDLRKGNFEVL